MERKAFLNLLAGMLATAPVANIVLPQRRFWALGGLPPHAGKITFHYENGLYLADGRNVGVGSTLSIGDQWGNVEMIRLTTINPDGSFQFEANPNIFENPRHSSIAAAKKRSPAYRALADSPTRAYRG